MTPIAPNAQALSRSDRRWRPCGPWSITSYIWRWLIPATMLLSFGTVPGLASPPFSTESAGIIDYGKTEIDIYMEGSHSQGYGSATFPGVQIDHGVLPGLQVRVTLPFALSSAAGKPHQFGIGDAQIGVKYQLIAERSLSPAVSVFPVIGLPVGNAGQGLGEGRPSLALPIWLEKHFGPWKVYGGGGYTIQGATQGRNSVFLGLGVLRQVTDKLSLGAEIFHREPRHAGAPGSTNINIGAGYDFDERYSLYFSVGRGVQNPRLTNMGSGYLGVAMKF